MAATDQPPEPYRALAPREPSIHGPREAANDARWTKTHGTSHYGYKNHVNVDRRHKLIRRDTVSDAAVHDSQALDDVLDDDNTASDVWADSAYRSAEIEETLDERGLKSRIHRKAHRNRPLTEREQQGNKTRSKVRARIEHVFGSHRGDQPPPRLNIGPQQPTQPNRSRCSYVSINREPAGTCVVVSKVE